MNNIIILDNSFKNNVNASHNEFINTTFYKYVYEYENSEFIDLLKRNNIYDDFSNEVLLPFFNNYQKLFCFEFSTNFSLKNKLSTYVTTTRISKIESITFKIKNDFLFYFLSCEKTYEKYLSYLKPFLQKNQIDYKLAYKFHHNEIVNNVVFDFDLEKFHEMVENNYDVFNSNSLAILFSSLEHETFQTIFKQSYNNTIHLFLSRTLNLIQSVEKLNYKKIESLYDINVEYNKWKSSLTVYFLQATNYESWICFVNESLKLNKELQFKNYEISISEITLVNYECFIKISKDLYKNKMWELIVSKSKLSLNVLVNYLLAAKNANNVSLNYALLTLYLDVNSQINLKNKYWILSKFYYFKTIKVISKIHLNKNQINTLENDVKIKYLLTNNTK